MCDSETTLRIVETAAQAGEVDGPVIALQEELISMTEAEVDEAFAVLVRARTGTGIWPPLLETVWPRLVVPFEGAPGQPNALSHLLALHGRLQERVQVVNPDCIDCRELDPEYRALIADLAAEHEIAVTPSFGRPRLRLLRGYLIGMVTVLLLLADQAASLLLRHFFNPVRRASVLFVPNFKRFDSVAPVLDVMDEAALVVPRPTLSWLWTNITGKSPDVASRDPVPIHRFVDLATLMAELKLFLIHFPAEVLVRGEMKTYLTDLLAAECGVALPRTVAHTLGQVYQHIRGLAYLYPMMNAIEAMETEGAVFGAAGYKQLAMLYAARELDVATFYIPHSVTIGYERIPPVDVAFIASQVGANHLRSSRQFANEDLTLKAAGRPLLEQQSTESSPTNAITEPLDIVVATQPYADEIRREFLTDVLDGLSAVEGETTVTIKPHPNESPAFYKSLVAERDGITVAGREETDLFGVADLVVTINSNVGVEAMLKGTAVVCVNEWSPLVRTRPYAEAGPVPVCETGPEIRQFFTQIDSQVLQNLRVMQTTFVDRTYLPGDATKTITDTIRDHL